MPIRFGGDMDDPNNPASPFMKREDVEQVAAEELGMSVEELAQAQAADAESGGARSISLVDQFAGTKLFPPGEGVIELTREEGLQLLCQALIGRMRSVRASLSETLDNGDASPATAKGIEGAMQELDDVLPPETEDEAAEASEYGN